MLIVALAIVYYFAVPMSVEVKLRLPESKMKKFKAGSLTIGDDVIRNLGAGDTTVTVSGLPGSWRLRSVPIEIRATDYVQKDTLVKLGCGLSTSIVVGMTRDDTYGVFSGKVIYKEGGTVKGAKVTIENRSAVTDVMGDFTIRFPENEQTATKDVVVTAEGCDTTVMKREYPGKGYQYFVARKK